MTTFLAFIFTLGLLITIHEYGHFIVARMFNVKVLRFSIGFGNPLWQTKFGKDQTEFVLAAIPLGGYVKMLDERELVDDRENGVQYNALTEKDLSRAFNRLPVLQRMAVVIAGPVANLLLAIILYWGLMMSGVIGLKPILGMVPPNSVAAASGFKENDQILKINGQKVQTWQEVRWEVLNHATQSTPLKVEVANQKYGLETLQLSIKEIDFENTKTDYMELLGFSAKPPVVLPKIGEVVNDSAAQRAGLQTGDVILAVNQEKITSWEAFVSIIKLHPSAPLSLQIDRAGNVLSLQITPDSVQENGSTIGRVGAGVNVDPKELDQFFVELHYGPVDALVKACAKTWETSIFSLKMLGKMLTGDVSWKMMSGPVTIANYAGQSAQMGVKIFVGFLALISISIGVLNLLPIPVLDGGHLMYYMVEFFTGRPVSENVLAIGQKVGLFLIGGMTILAFYNDISRLIIG